MLARAPPRRSHTLGSATSSPLPTPGCPSRARAKPRPPDGLVCERAASRDGCSCADGGEGRGRQPSRGAYTAAASAHSADVRCAAAALKTAPVDAATGVPCRVALHVRMPWTRVPHVHALLRRADLLEESAVLAHYVEVAQVRHFERAEIVGKVLERTMPKLQSSRTKANKTTNQQTHPPKKNRAQVEIAPGPHTPASPAGRRQALEVAPTTNAWRPGQGGSGSNPVQPRYPARHGSLHTSAGTRLPQSCAQHVTCPCSTRSTSTL